MPPTFPDRFNLADYFLFERLREGLGGKVALRFGENAYTYDEVAGRTRAFAAALEEADVRRGERVLIVLPDLPAFAWVFFGTLARGCVVAMANPDAPAESLELPRRVHARDGHRDRPPRRRGAARPHAVRRRRARGAPRLVRRHDADRVRRPGGDPDAGVWDRVDGIFSLPRRRARRSSTLAKPHAHAPRRAGDLALHERLDRRAEGEHPHAPRLRLQHRGLRQAHRRLSRRTTSPSACRASSSATRPARTSCSRSRSAPPSALFSERPTPGDARRARSTRTARPSSPTCRRCSASSSITTTRCARPASPGSISRACASRSRPARRCPSRSSAAGSSASRSDVYDGIGSAEMFHIYASQPPRRRQAGLARQGRRGLRAPHPARGGRGPRRARRARRARSASCGCKGDSVSHGYWLDRDKSWKTFHGHWCRRAISSASTTTATSTSRGAPTICSRSSGLWVAPRRGRGVPDAPRRRARSRRSSASRTRASSRRRRSSCCAQASRRARRARASSSRSSSRRASRSTSIRASIEFVDDLPKNDRGKVDRRALRDRAAREKAAHDRAAREKAAGS